MEKPKLTNGCVESPEIEVITSSGGLVNLMVRVWVLCLLESSFSPALWPSIFLLSSLKVFSTLSNLMPDQHVTIHV